MIKFFRKIRQRLLTENKFSKYLLYAFGEIVLVVIGILIALQVNNLNQYKNDRVEEHNILIRLQKDLQNDLNNVNFLYDYNDKLIKDLELIINGLSERNLEIDNFVKYNMRIGFSSVYDQIRSTYNETLAAGKLDLIINDSLRDTILKFYEREDFGADYATTTYMNNYIVPNFFKIMGHTNEFTSVVYQKPTNFNAIDLEEIYNNRNYRSIVNSKLSLLKEQIRQWSGLENRLNLILKNIQNELDERWPNHKI